MKKGFTLSEVLITVLIMMVLVSMAVPTYEKMIEKSRLSEARTMLKRIYESKMRILDNMDKTTYDGSFGFDNLDYRFECKSTIPVNGHIVACSSDDFMYWMAPVNVKPTSAGVCAVRLKGDGAGISFTYEYDDDDKEMKFRCDGGRSAKCKTMYGMANGSVPQCSATVPGN